MDSSVRNIHLFSKITITLEPVWCSLTFRIYKSSLFQDWMHHFQPFGHGGGIKIFSQSVSQSVTYWIIDKGVSRTAPAKPSLLNTVCCCNVPLNTLYNEHQALIMPSPTAHHSGRLNKNWTRSCRDRRRKRGEQTRSKFSGPLWLRIGWFDV